MQSSSSRRSLLNYIGVAVLMVGTGAGEFIYWRSLHAADRTSDEEIMLTPETSRIYERNVETNIGTFGLIMVKFSNAMAKLGEPKPLAITLVVVSALAAGGCFLLASRIPRD